MSKALDDVSLEHSRKTTKSIIMGIKENTLAGPCGNLDNRRGFGCILLIAGVTPR